MDKREPGSLDTCIRDLTTSAGKITIQNTIPPTAPDIIVRSGPKGNMFSVQVKVTQFQRKLIPWEKNNLQVFENKMLRKIFAYKEDAVKGQLGSLIL
jgi:hypothetical protein